jgi:hypothetical protein
VNLISNGTLAARIDAAAGVVDATTTDARAAVFTDALAAGDAYNLQLKSLLLKQSLAQKKLFVKGTRYNRRGGGGGGDVGVGGGGGGDGGGGDDTDDDGDFETFDLYGGGITDFSGSSASY